MTVDDRFLGGRVAWVTGGGSGIGKAIALALARRGPVPAVLEYPPYRWRDRTAIFPERGYGVAVFPS